jgi:DNA-binding PadR family transcriptional regulator
VADFLKKLLAGDMPRVPSVSNKEGLLLELLVTGERYGLDLVKSSNGQLKRGTVYVTLSRMEDKGYISARADEQGRRLYKVEGLGQSALSAWRALAAGVLETLGGAT